MSLASWVSNENSISIEYWWLQGGSTWFLSKLIAIKNLGLS